MSKDPATLWYWNDWHGGTVTYSRHLKGCYMDLLYAQFNSGRLSLEEIKTVLGNDFASWGALSKKFVQDEHGLFYNERAEAEQLKRKKFSKSRRENLMGDHMENANENRIRKLKIEFNIEVEKFENYSPELRKEFFEYWTELNASKTKMRYEKQETFEISKRLATWARNNFQPFSKNGTKPFPDFYDSEYVKTISPEKLQEYWSHLRGKGFKFINGRWTK